MCYETVKLELFTTLTIFTENISFSGLNRQNLASANLSQVSNRLYLTGILFPKIAPSSKPNLIKAI
jgi:hypothetical protein